MCCERKWGLRVGDARLQSVYMYKHHQVLDSHTETNSSSHLQNETFSHFRRIMTSLTGGTIPGYLIMHIKINEINYKDNDVLLTLSGMDCPLLSPFSGEIHQTSETPEYFFNRWIKGIICNISALRYLKTTRRFLYILMHCVLTLSQRNLRSLLEVTVDFICCLLLPLWKREASKQD